MFFCINACGILSSTNSSSLKYCTTSSNGALLSGDNQSHYLATADTIDMLIGVSGAVTDTAKIKVWAVVADCS